MDPSNLLDDSADDDDDHHPDDDVINDDDRLPGETEDQIKHRKRKERLEQNRISARESRKRKKTMIEELQRTVITLSRENKDLNERNEQLRRNLMEIGTKVSRSSSHNKIMRLASPTDVTRHLDSIDDVEITMFSTGRRSNSINSVTKLMNLLPLSYLLVYTFIHSSFYLSIYILYLTHSFHQQYPNIVPIHAIMGGAMAAPPPVPQQHQQNADPNNPYMWRMGAAPQHPQQQQQQVMMAPPPPQQQQMQQQQQMVVPQQQQQQQQQQVMQQQQQQQVMQQQQMVHPQPVAPAPPQQQQQQQAPQ